MRPAGTALAVSAALFVALATPAGAATTVGSSLRQRANLYVRCSSDCTAVQTVRPGGTGLTLPVDGVITRWRVRAATMGSVRLRIIRREDGGGYTSLAAGDWVRLDRPHQPGHDILYEFPVRLPVHAGDTIALDRDPRAGGIFHYYGTNTSYAAAVFSPALADSGADVQPTSSDAGRELLLNADVEKDADGDGFGDESQDNCPTIPNDQTDKPCSTPTPGAGATPEGPTSTPIATTPPTRGQGSQGPPVAGEPGIDKNAQRHRMRRGTRAAPPAPSATTRGHERPRSPRPTPKPEGPATDRHEASPAPRDTPVTHSRPHKRHDQAPVRPAPRQPTAPSGKSHDRQPARSAPKPTHRNAGRHGGKPSRPVPPAPPAPVWHHH
jgi:hypothetical protein